MSEDMNNWEIPYNFFQFNTIIANYKTSGFPCSKVIAAIRRWPWNLTKCVAKNYNKIEQELLHPPIEEINISQISAAATNHDMYRQEVIHKMKSLILDKNVSKNSMQLPLMKLERNLFSRTHALRFIRKHFPYLVPRRKRKNRKRSKAKMDKKMNKKKEKNIKALKKKKKKKKGNKNPETVVTPPVTADEPASPKVVEPGITLESMRAHFNKKIPRLTSWHPMPLLNVPKTKFDSVRLEPRCELALGSTHK